MKRIKTKQMIIGLFALLFCLMTVLIIVLFNHQSLAPTQSESKKNIQTSDHERITEQPTRVSTEQTTADESDIIMLKGSLNSTEASVGSSKESPTVTEKSSEKTVPVSQPDDPTPEESDQRQLQEWPKVHDGLIELPGVRF